MRFDFAGDIVFSEDQISGRVRELAGQMTGYYVQAYEEGTPLTIVSVLKGGFVFLADLIRCMDLDIRVDFMAISSYRESTRSSGAVKIVKDLSQGIYRKHVLLVEDIVDTGLTLSYILRNLTSREPADIKVCTLLDRAVRRIAPLEIDFVGFQVGEDFLVGYGLDYHQQGRNMPYICRLESSFLHHISP
ncbi:MAG: hypoxanthine phosphoribosyltransferase [Actinomycetota bacterium]|nr:hypoxanthine phosphoribosyltransferase [Actinomycetota bacterium]